MTKRAFPALDKFCHDRNVFFSPVDLRWGITAEQAEDGKVIQLCLGEVDRSRPYFVGMLGDRYGWHINPDIGDARLEETFKFAEQFYPWLKNHRSSSVTELEVLHGALNAPKEHHSRIFFYLRTQIPPNAPEEDLDSYRSESAYAAERLKILKDRIRSSGLKYFEYSDITAMGDQLLADLQAAIEADFPSNNALSPLVKERLENHAFAETRARVYVGGYDSFKRLDEYVDSFVKEPLVVLGESGSGKSSLMANWSIKYEEKHADQLMITHYIGATPSSSYHYSLLRRVMAEIKEYLDLPDEVPTDMDELVPQFPIWFEKVCPAGDFPAEPPEPPKKERSDKAEEIDPEFVAKEEACRQQYLSKHIKPRMVLVLDAINQLENRDNAHDLTWLPKVFPRAVRVIISTLPGRCLDVLQGRKWPTWTVTGLKSGDKREIMDKYLQLYSKTLSEQQADAISENSNTDNPLFLRTLLNELRIIGNFENLDIQIGQYLSADGPAGLYELVLTRWEEDYGGGQLVSDMMSLIWVSSQGVSEVELLSILKVNRHTLSPLLLAAQEVMVTRNGLMGFFHDHLRHAVQHRYLQDEKVVAKYRRILADFFIASKPKDGQRRIEEVPFQLEKLEDVATLQIFATDLDVFVQLYHPSRINDLTRYWRKIGIAKALPAYQAELAKVRADTEDFVEISNKVAYFLYKLGRYMDSTTVYKTAFEIAEKIFPSTDMRLANTLCLYSEVLGKYGAPRSHHLQRAIDIVKKNFGDRHPDIVFPLTELAIIHSGSEFDRALQEVRLAKEIGDAASPVWQAKNAENYCNTIRTCGRIYWKNGRYEEAIPYYREALKQAEMRLGPTHTFTASVTNALGLNLQKAGNLEEGRKYLELAVKLGYETLGPDHPTLANRLLNMGSLMLDLNRPLDSIHYFEEAYRIFCMEFGETSRNSKSPLSWLRTAYPRLNDTENVKKIEALLAKIQG
eukprot:TRINITY_DN261_c0_g1_i3.p1 TRINITY_DN261_c0_g1~~TRINITY_DN261_c0_g1_i3.p1  ORF type:complete len:1013 (-),score=273.37 TRINITY_DN261_c0_g1_i3:40-2928(-)